MTKVQLSLEKVLTVSAGEYVDSVGKRLNDYVLMGVHETTKSLKGEFLDVPEGTEVLVGYSVNRDERSYVHFGTALVPKEKEVAPSAFPDPLLGPRGPIAVLGQEGSSKEQRYSLKIHLVRKEKELIIGALGETEGNKSRAASLLEISHRALLYKLKEYGL